LVELRGLQEVNVCAVAGTRRAEKRERQKRRDMIAE